MEPLKQVPAAVQEVEVSAKGRRRQFSAEEKRRILREADACQKPGELGALLRREGIYSSNLSAWRKARARGELDALTPKKRGPAPAPPNPLAPRVAELQRALAKAEARAQRAEAVVEVQKKISELLGIQLPKTSEEG